MAIKQIDQKQPEENTEFIKEEHDPKRNYIFQKNRITKTGFIIILAILILFVLVIIFSGIFFQNPGLNL